MDKILQKFDNLFAIRNEQSFKNNYRMRKEELKFYFEIYFRSDVIQVSDRIYEERNSRGKDSKVPP